VGKGDNVRLLKKFGSKVVNNVEGTDFAVHGKGGERF